MNRLILVRYLDNNLIVSELLNNDYEYRKLKATKPDNLQTLFLTVGRGSYSEKQERAHELAVNYQEFISESSDVNFSILELSRCSEYFDKIGHLYGLIGEFRENAIC